MASNKFMLDCSLGPQLLLFSDQLFLRISRRYNDILNGGKHKENISETFRLFINIKRIPNKTLYRRLLLYKKRIHVREKLNVFKKLIHCVFVYII